MKYMKFIVPLAIVVLMLMIALPVAADDPFGGPPSRTSGNGATTWAAVYVSGYGASQLNAAGYTTPACSTSTFSAGSSKFFKYDTHKSYDVELYLDDSPKYGAALDYFGFGASFYTGEPSKTLGNDNDALAGGQQPIPFKVGWKPDSTQEPENLQGFAALVYGSNYMKQMDYYWPTPNNLLLTTRAGSRARVSSTEGGYGGYNRAGASVNTIREKAGNPDVADYLWLRRFNIKMADGNTHLLSARTRDDGWNYVRAFNNMIWDNDASFCVSFIRRAEYDFPNSTPGVPAFKTVP
jgi:hypothetical protein